MKLQNPLGTTSPSPDVRNNKNFLPCTKAIKIHFPLMTNKLKWFGLLILLLLVNLPVQAEDWTTADGKTYRNVVVVAQEDDGVRVTYTGGVGKIPYYELSPDLQKRFGEDYESLEAKRLAAVKALAEATRKAQEAAQQLKQQDMSNIPPTHNEQQNTKVEIVKTSPTPDINSHPAEVRVSAPPQPAQNKYAAEYPGSNFSYDNGPDVCYLDSPAVDILLQPLDVTIQPSYAASLQCRICTDGSRPEKPDKIEAILFPKGTITKIPADSKATFLVDGTSMVIEMEEDGGTDPSVDRIPFVLSPTQLGMIFNGKKVDIKFANNDYIIDDNGLNTFRKYLADINRLPPASTNFVRAYHKFLNRLPSIADAISEVCVYIVLGSFSIVMFVFAIAFLGGMTRFLKM